MKRHLQITIATIFALLSVGFVHAQEENALDKKGQYADQALDIIDAFKNGYTTPMRIVGSKGNASVDIGIDTVRYVRKGKNEVSLDAHINLQIPFAIEDGKESTKINFKGTGLPLAGGGSSKIYMETNLPPLVLLEEKISLRFIADENTFVTFGCDGIEEIGLNGEFIFDPKFIEPAENNTNDTVKASFQTVVADWDDLLFKVDFNGPFKISGGGDFVFVIEDVVVDFSTQSNVAGFTFPIGYKTAFPDNDVNLWTGFAIKKIAVTPPSEITELGGESRPFTYEVSNMLIDELGLTGAFMAMREPQLASGESNSGLNLSIDTIGITITKNRITGGILGGAANVPFLKDKDSEEPLHLGISGQVQYDVKDKKLHYRISAAMLNSQTYAVPFTDKADITLEKGCAFTAGNIAPGNKFGATLLLNGTLNIRADLNIEGIRFEGLALSSFSPHFDWVRFGLVGAVGLEYAGFSISLNELGLTKNGENEATLNVAAQIALMSGSMSIGAKAEFEITTVYKQNKNKWEFENFDVKAICLETDFSAFRFKGYIRRFNNEGMYGDGFKGDIELKVKSFGLEVNAIVYFGKTDYDKEKAKVNSKLDYKYKYWFTQIDFTFPGTGVLLFPPAVKLKSITGGAYQHMSNSLCIAGEKEPGQMKLSDIIKTPDYVPDEKTAFGFIAGIGANIASDNLVTIKVLLEMAFNSNCGLRYVSLKGLGSFLSDDVEKAPVQAAVFTYYNVEDKIFSLQAAVDANFFKIIKGGGQFVLYSSPKKWYCNVGTYEKSAKLTVKDLVDVKVYFMAGEIPSQLPPLNPKIISLFGQNGYSKANSASTSNGTGFAFGISLSADCGFNKDEGFVFAYIDIDGGIDALVDFNPRNCGSDPVKWRGAAQLYFYMDGEAGVRVRKKKYPIISLTAAAKLGAEIPAPYYFEGRIAFNYKVLFVKGSISQGFSKGTRC
ncbi:MAG: hypothetical protein FWC39_12910 [Bacteroidetes bacterium]|nr:hypothetical protein [Bacteroidota bacterium]